MTERRSAAWKRVQVALTLVVVAFAVWYLWRQWSNVAENGVRFEFHMGWMLAASAIILATFLMLVEMWRRVLGELGFLLPYGAAARIWFVSNLGKYVPGRIWTLTSVAMMAGERGVPVGVSAASSILVMVANIATGFSVVLLMSAGAVQRIAGGTAGIVAVTAGLFILLIASPYIASHWNRLASRFPKLQLSVSIPRMAIVVAIVGCTLSWFMYGVAFMLFVRSLIGPPAAPYSAFVAANAAAYLVGYLAIVAPAGIGFREVAMATLLPALHISTAPQAAVITVASRIWLTVLEIVPSLVALMQKRRRARPESRADQSRGSRIP